MTKAVTREDLARLKAARAGNAPPPDPVPARANSGAATPDDDPLKEIIEGVKTARADAGAKSDKAVEEVIESAKTARADAGAKSDKAARKPKSAKTKQDPPPNPEAGEEGAATAPPEPEPAKAEPPPEDEAARLPGSIWPTAFRWIDPQTIPRRKWVYGRHYIRQFITTTYAVGGGGKSMLAVAEALAMATGKPLLGRAPTERVRVWYWNGEDPRDELERRVMAAVKHYGLKSEDFDDWLFVDSGRKMPIVIAEDVPVRGAGTKTRIAEPVVAAVTASIKAMKIDVLIIDPFVSCHEVHENDNGAIHRVARAWAEIAEETNCAVELVHHTRKTGGLAVTVEDGRGAGALTFAARSARALNTMTADEAAAADIPEQMRRRYFQLYNGKTNLAPPPERSDWFRIESVDVGVPLGFEDEADTTGVVTAFAYPDKRLRVTAADVARAQARIAAGGPWRENPRSTKQPWVGIPIAEALGADLASKVDRRAIIKLIKDWLGIGLLRITTVMDEKRKPRRFVEVGTSPLPNRNTTPEDDGEGDAA